MRYFYTRIEKEIGVASTKGIYGTDYSAADAGYRTRWTSWSRCAYQV